MAAVSVWVATDPNGSQWMSKDEPQWIDNELGYDIHEPFDYLSMATGVNVPPGECREFVLIPTDEYTPQQQAGLSETAKLIAELAHRHYISPSSGSPEIHNAVGDAKEIVALSIAAASEIGKETP